MSKTRPLILVVEDDSQTQRVLNLILDHAGYEVECAGDGLDGLLKIETLSPELVVLDLMLPVLDGWEVLKRLQQVDHPPVVVLSAHLDRTRAMEAGAAACLGKPFTIDDLVQACEQVLDRASRTRA